MRNACWIHKATNTHSQYIIFIDFFTGTVVTRTRLNVALCVHCLVFVFGGAQYLWVLNVQLASCHPSENLEF